MQKTCKKCSANFEITKEDLEFYKKISPKFDGKVYEISTPTLCPNCRQQRRLSFINERNLYKNICHGCGVSIISRFNEESKIINYCNKCWSLDSRNFLEHGLEFDFNKTFFEQIEILIKKTPFQNLIGSLSNIENNASYTNYTAEIKDSYMIFESDYIEECLYGKGLRNCHLLIDSLYCNNSANSYECIDCDNIFKCFFGIKSINSKNSYFLYDCINCEFCFGCTNLRNKKYCIENKQFLKEEYFKEINKILSKGIHNYKKIFINNVKNIPKINLNIFSSEKCIGNNIYNSSNCENSYDIISSENIKYSIDINNSEYLMDISAYGSKSSYMYEGLSVGRFSKNIIFCNTIGKGEDLIYCIDTKKSSNCFGCVNIKDSKYCILNKQYTKEEYNKLVPKIIEHMQKTGEWGEFFPSNISPFGYNETVAQEYFPLSKESKDVWQKHLFNWSDYEPPKPNVEKIIPAEKLPEDINKIPDDILNWAIKCEVSGKPFRIIKQELEFYRKHNLPIPRKHPDIRHLERMKLRNPRKLFDRKCDKCEKDIKTTYAPDREEIVYCEGCYEKEVY